MVNPSMFKCLSSFGNGLLTIIFLIRTSFPPPKNPKTSPCSKNIRSWWDGFNLECCNQKQKWCAKAGMEFATKKWMEGMIFFNGGRISMESKHMGDGIANWVDTSTVLGNGTVIMMEKNGIKMDGFLLDLLCFLGIPSFDSYPNSQRPVPPKKDVRCVCFKLWERLRLSKSLHSLHIRLITDF